MVTGMFPASGDLLSVLYFIICRPCCCMGVSSVYQGGFFCKKSKLEAQNWAKQHYEIVIATHIKVMYKQQNARGIFHF